MEPAKAPHGTIRARAILERSRDFAALRGRGHHLINGATLTCASDLPWQIQMRCARCREIFWFDNLTWSAGGADRWRLSPESRSAAAVGCAEIAANLAIADGRQAAFAPARGQR